jgi:excisionase family DNA binding protein
MARKQGLTVEEAARRLGKAASTVYGMIKRGELRTYDEGGQMRISEEVVAAAPRRTRGHPRVGAGALRGKKYAALADKGHTIAEIAKRFGVTTQAVSHEILRYREAAIREAE